MNKIRIGIAGLGGIAQKAYLPVLTRTDNWVLSGGFSPNALLTGYPFLPRYWV